jgi:tRNA (guanine10-N2)-methyltransferase
MKFLVHFAQFHPEFRLPELLSLAQLNQINLEYDSNSYSNDCPFLVVELSSIEDAKKLVKRSVLVKEIVELWSHAHSLDSLFEGIKSCFQFKNEFYKKCSFKFHVEAYGYTLTLPEQIQRIESFSWMGCEGKIDLKSPQVTFGYYEDYSGQAFNGKKLTCPPRNVYFGVILASGNRNIVSKYDLKKREYLGTTSMDAELSLIMANQALVGPGSLVLDPFVGTGSFLITCSHFGAYTIGSDIDGRQIRGSGKGIDSNVSQYNLQNLVLGTLVCDIAHHPWKKQEIFDAIVCDPPYGVRAGAKKIASTNMSPYKKNGELRYPTTEPYEMTLVISDLISFAVTYLNPKGRLVFWLPTLNEE